MKKILSVFPVALIIMALPAFGGETIAQQQSGRDKANKEVSQTKQKGKEKAKEADEALQKEQERAREAGQKEKERMKETYGDNQDQERGKGRGNAYGRNKGGIEGRDFGQARAEEARMKHQEKKSELDRKVEDGELRTVEARERIRVAREELEKEKASKKISDEAYQQKKEKIDKAEKAVSDLEEKIRKGKSVPGEI